MFNQLSGSLLKWFDHFPMGTRWGARVYRPSLLSPGIFFLAMWRAFLLLFLRLGAFLLFVKNSELPHLWKLVEFQEVLLISSKYFKKYRLYSATNVHEHFN